MGIGINISFDETSLSFGEINEKPPRNKGKSMMILPVDYVVIDIETTGLSPDYDEIIELSALKCHNDEVVDKFSTLVKPEYEIDEYITELTGITNEMVKDAPDIEQALPQYMDFIGDNIVIGHNVNFDINFIYDNWYYIFGKEFKNDFVDLLRLSRKLFPNLSSHKLSTLSEHFNISSPPTHRGLDDCFATFECYINCKKYVQDNNIDISLYEKNWI